MHEPCGALHLVDLPDMIEMAVGDGDMGNISRGQAEICQLVGDRGLQGDRENVLHHGPGFLQDARNSEIAEQDAFRVVDEIARVGELVGLACIVSG